MHIYPILGTKMVVIRPSWGSDLEKVGVVRCVFVQSMILVCFTKWPDGIVFEFWTNLCTFTEFWKLKWPPFGHLG